MKRGVINIVAAGLLALLLVTALARCSDDGAPTDQGTAADATPKPDQAPVSDQAPSSDQAPATDQSGATDQGGGADAGSGPKNSGALCSTSTPCADARETCTYFGGAQGMCLAPCKQQGDPCPVMDKTTQLATCSIKGLDPTKWFCGYLCEVGGKTYACPNATDYACVAASAGFKFCEPK